MDRDTESSKTPGHQDHSLGREEHDPESDPHVTECMDQSVSSMK